jgi:DNA-binding HxlR family transcriptional regulator
LALDAVGERWALLIVRELMFGPKRFVDLRAGLPQASQNVLSARLKELESAGVIARVKLGPPSRAQVYELTAAGAALEPAVVALAQWGARLDVPHGSRMSADSYALLLKALYVPTGEGTATVTLDLDSDVFEMRLGPDDVQIHRGAAHAPDAVIRGTVQSCWEVLFGRLKLEDAITEGSVAIGGDQVAADRFLRSFPAPSAFVGAGAPMDRAPA